MLSLQRNHILNLFVMVDDLLPEQQYPKGGRPPILWDSELVTALIWNSLTLRQKTLKDVYNWLDRDMRDFYPHLPCYVGFIIQCHRILPKLTYILSQLLRESGLVFVDSTMLEVCKSVRADDHKVAKGIARFGKNHQGWHYGFKLHASIDPNGCFTGLYLTPANESDSQQMPHLTNKTTKVAVGDGGYTASVMNTFLWNSQGTFVLSPPHPKQKKKLLARWQLLLLRMRPKIEATFDYLKEHMHLVSSFPRSVEGYLLHYVRILLGYQLMHI